MIHTLESKIENMTHTVESKIENITQNTNIMLDTLESKIIFKLENILHTFETKTLNIISELTSQIKLLSDYNEITKTQLEIQIAKHSTILSDHFKLPLPTQFKIENTASYNFLPLQINNSNILQFDIKSINNQLFIYSDNNQTITYKGKDYWRMIYINKPLPKNQISIINFRIEKNNYNNGNMIGICPVSILNDTGICFNTTMGAYAYYGVNPGYIYYNKTYVQSNGGEGFGVGSIIRMTVNLLEYTVEWMKDYKMMHKMNLDKSYVNQEMYACLHLYYEGDSISILNN